MDSYLFENFNTVDGDFLTAKFRAFKFPESTYVQFKGTVNVCLDKCRGVSKIIYYVIRFHIICKSNQVLNLKSNLFVTLRIISFPWLTNKK